jgi:transcriptional regulator of arginine metabolism
MPAELVSKRIRQEAIMEVVRTLDVHNQLELIRHLEARGITATQSSVSRDIHELSIAKVDGRYMIGVLPTHRTGEPEETEDGRAFVRSLAPAGPNLLIVRTITGQAETVGLSIDHSRWPEVLGVVSAGETVFVATDGKREQLRLIARLREFMPQPILPAPETVGSSTGHLPHNNSRQF